MAFLLKPLSFLFIIFFTYFLKKQGIFKKEYALIVLAIIMNMTLPATIITVFSTFERDFSLLWLAVIGLAVSVIPFFGAWFFTRRKTKEERAYYMICISGSNIGCYGLPVIQAFYGTFGALVCIMLDIGNAMMMTSGNYAFTSLMLHTDGDGERVTAGAVIKRFFSSVPVDCYIILFLLSVCNVRIPQVVLDFVSPLAAANAFLAMFMLGLLFSPGRDGTYIHYTAIIVPIRYAIMAAAAFLCYRFLPFDLEVRQVLCVLLFCPIGAFAPAFIEKCHGDGEMAAFTNSVSTILSLIIMTTLTAVFQH